MNPNTLVVVSAYAGDQNQVEHSLPVYLHHQCPVVVLSPTDAPIKLDRPDVVCMSAGLKGWIGPQTLERQRKFLEIMLTFPHGHFLFHDADSVCLSPEIPKYLYESPDTIWSNEVIDTNPAPSLLPKLALQPPYFLSRKSIAAMLRCELPTSYFTRQNPTDWPLPFPTECIDHWMLQVACGSGHKHSSFFNGASFETGSPAGFAEMRNVVRNYGRVLLHSIKKSEVLTALISDHAEFRKNNP
jgi:hypothetical protein